MISTNKKTEKLCEKFTYGSAHNDGQFFQHSLIPELILPFDTINEFDHIASGTNHFRDILRITCHIRCSDVILVIDRLHGCTFLISSFRPRYRSRASKENRHDSFQGHFLKRLAPGILIFFPSLNSFLKSAGFFIRSSRLKNPVFIKSVSIP